MGNGSPSSQLWLQTPSLSLPCSSDPLWSIGPPHTVTLNRSDAKVLLVDYAHLLLQLIR